MKRLTWLDSEKGRNARDLLLTVMAILLLTTMADIRTLRKEVRTVNATMRVYDAQVTAINDINRILLANDVDYGTRIAEIQTRLSQINKVTTEADTRTKR